MFYQCLVSVIYKPTNSHQSENAVHSIFQWMDNVLECNGFGCCFHFISFLHTFQTTIRLFSALITPLPKCGSGKLHHRTNFFCQLHFGERFEFANEKCMKYKSWFCYIFFLLVGCLFAQSPSVHVIWVFKLDQLSDLVELCGANISMYLLISLHLFALVMAKLRHIAQFFFLHPFKSSCYAAAAIYFFLPLYFFHSANCTSSFKCRKAAAFITQPNFSNREKENGRERDGAREKLYADFLPVSGSLLNDIYFMIQ